MRREAVPDLEPWEFGWQGLDTAKSFEAFVIFRDAGPERTIVSTAETLGKSVGWVGEWASKYRWQFRVAEWDREADRLSRERDRTERDQARKRMLDDHSRVGQAAVAIAARILRKYGTDTPEAVRELAELGPQDAARLFDVGAKWQRMALGEPTERYEVRQLQRFVDEVIDCCLEFLDEDRHEVFLAEVNRRVGAVSIG